MKKLMMLIALFTSVLFFSCSDAVTEPVSEDGTNKTADNRYLFPYKLYQSFEEIKAEWDYAVTDDETDITIRLDKSLEEIEDIFVMVSHGDPLVDTDRDRYLYFVDQPGADVLALNLESDKPVQTVKVFILNRVFEFDVTAPYVDTYPFRQVHSTWNSINDGQIEVSAMPWTPDVLEVYAHINMFGIDELVFLQLPADNNKITIPGYDATKVQGVHLFVNSDPTID